MTPKEFVKAHEGLWSMLGSITYKITKDNVKIFNDGKHIRTWFEYRGKENDRTCDTKRKE
tara:strand:+ start:503 stop:682 length:180 start_codon:yes stop_codon:yes gene_type:complete